MQAKALFYAIFVSLLMVIVTAIMIQFASDSHLIYDYDKQRMGMVENLRAAELILLENRDGKNYIGNRTFDLYGEGEDSVQITLAAWGLWDVATAKVWKATFKGRDELKRASFVGMQANQKELSYALSMPNRNKPLVISGKSKLIGKLLLSPMGLKPSTVEGRICEFPNSGEITSQVIRSMPNIDTIRINQTLALKNIGKASPIVPPSLQMSFFENTHIIKGERIRLGNTILKGNILVVADSVVNISAQAQLSDIIVMANTVEVEKGFKGNIQIIANRHVTIGQDVELTYPSSIVLIAAKFDGPQALPHLLLHENSNVEGAIVVLDKSPTHNALTKLMAGSQVRGSIYCQGYLDLKGSIIGTAFVEQFIHKSASGVYDNYLVDGSINFDLLPSYFAIPPFLIFDEKISQSLMKIVN